LLLNYFVAFLFDLSKGRKSFTNKEVRPVFDGYSVWC